MAKIRSEQMQAFSKASLDGFENRMLEHLRKFFPRHCETLGERKTREMIRTGIREASKYDIVAERDVCKYIDLMFAFGRDFDQNPNLPWARQILTDRATADPTVRVNRLYAAALEHQGRRRWST